LWSNTISLINVITAGLIAMNYFAPLADFFDKQWPQGTYVWDFFSIWLIFIISVSILRAATDYMSRVKVRLFPPVDRFGGMLMACWVSWIVMGFATMTLHTAPLARNFLDGSFQKTPTSRNFFGFLAPDHVWLGWVHRESMGPLCRLRDVVPFDARGDFILRYGERREAFDQQISFLKSGTTGGPAAK
jgi:hypothetical protein